MARTRASISLAVAMAFAVAGVASAQPPKQGVPLVLDFDNNLCVIGPGWCGDARGPYESDSGQTAVVEITYHDHDDNGVGGGAIADVTSQTMFGWSPPNDDFFRPEDCGICGTGD